MFFYRDTVIHANSKEELLGHSECPICKNNNLVHDWKMPLRYEPMALLRMGLIGAAFGTLLCFLLVKLEAKGWLDFLNQFSYSVQTKLIVAFLACICLPAAFFVILAEIKLAHWTRDDMVPYGLKCTTCGNGFVGLVNHTYTEESPSHNEPPVTDDL